MKKLLLNNYFRRVYLGKIFDDFLKNLQKFLPKNFLKAFLTRGEQILRDFSTADFKFTSKFSNTVKKS